MKLSILTFLTLAATSNAAFVPPHKLAQMTQPLRSTVNPSSSSSSIGTEESQTTGTPALNEDKFLQDMDSSLGELNKKKEPVAKKSKKKRGPVAFPDPIPADPAYITEARMRLAALADRAEERAEHYAWEVQELKKKSVWDSFRKPQSDLPPPENLVKYKDIVKKDDAKNAAFMGSVSTTDTTTGSNSGAGFIGLAIVVAAAATVVEPAAVTDFLNNLDLDLSKLDLSIDLTGIQAQVQATAAAVTDYVGNINVEMPKLDLDIGAIQAQAQAQAAAVTDYVDGINVEMPKLDLDLSGIQAQAQAQAAAVTGIVSNINVEMPKVDLDVVDLAAIQEQVQSTVASSQETLAQAAAQLESSAANIQLDVDLSAIQEQVQASGAAVTNFVGNVDLDMPKLDVELSAIQEQVQGTAMNLQSGLVGSVQDLSTSVQEQASSALNTMDSSAVLISTKEDLEALLRQ